MNEKGKPILRDSSPSGIDGRIEHLRSLEELQALYLVHGDFNEPDDRRRGEQFLGRMAADPGVSLVEERPRKSLGFHGNPHLNLGSDPLLAAPVFTLTLWLRVERLDRDIVPVEKFEWQRSGYYLKYHQSEKSLYGEIFDGGNTRRIVRFRGAEAGRWMQLALRADGQRLSAFLDGKLVDSVPAGQAVPNDLPLLVGRGTMDVCLADLRFYRRALGAAEISALIR